MNLFLSAGVALFLSARGVHPYIDATPTLGQIMKDSTDIVVLEVEKVNAEKRIIIYKKAAGLKGTLPGDEMRHQITIGWHPRESKIILDWAEPGKRAICFHDGKIAVTCIGQYWYQTSALESPWWTMTSGRPELSLAFFGPVEKLRRAAAEMLAGKEAVITAVSHGSGSGVWQYGNVGFNKVLRGRDCPLWRVKASLEMPGSISELGNKDAKWVIGSGVAGPEDVPQLEAALKDPSSERRREAAEDLGRIGRAAKRAVPELVRATQDPDPQVRVSAARAVGLLDPDRDGVRAVLESALKDPAPAVRKSAAEALGDLGAQARPSVPALALALEDAEPAVRWSAAEALGRLGGEAEDAVAPLAIALRDPGIRAISADALGSIGSASRGSVPLLLDGLKDADLGFRWMSAVALTRIDAKAARAALPLLIERLKDSDARARWDAMQCVTAMGLEAKPAAPAVLEMVKKGDGVAADILTSIAGPEALEALPVLLENLSDDWDLSESIARIGSAAVPTLLKSLETKDEKKGPLIVKTLGLLASKSKDLVPTLEKLLGHPEARLRSAAADALGGIEPKQKESVPSLLKALADDDLGVRLAAARALFAVQGPEAQSAIPVLAQALKDEDPDNRREAASVLGGFAGAGKTALPALTLALKDSDGGVRCAVAWAMARITGGQATQTAIEVMLSGLKDKEPRARQDAARLLGEVGTDARSAAPALTAALEDDNEDVRKAAQEALGKVQGK
ncbi:MAG TPA: HEAT repeat domain-containing protein [Planctomycetota bacterium]|nr:HEAT repeat domain-containing protein [Planctomycetota bacterium]